MNQEYIKPDAWSIIEEGFDRSRIRSSESLFSLANGAMGQRANFEECYSGESFQGSYIAGVYYPDRTRVGWWKNGYPKYFAKVLNAPNWIGINVWINDELLDLNKCIKVEEFRRELNMKEGWYQRSFVATLLNSSQVAISTTRFLSLTIDEIGAIKYEVTLLSEDAHIKLGPYLDSGITNQDSNWDDAFWETTNISTELDSAFIFTRTLKSNFQVCTFMGNLLFYNGEKAKQRPTVKTSETSVTHIYEQKTGKGGTLILYKFGGYTTSRDHDASALKHVAITAVHKATDLGFENLLDQQKHAWNNIWKKSNIVIEGDLKAQQGIRFNIFQLNQTYTGKDSRLNIGPKGFTGEKYGGSTYWDTEAYCLPFFMATKDHKVARNLLKYRFNHLDKAIENAAKLGMINGAALYPMVTMNGEECHNEWEITFEEIHRNGAIAFAIFNYYRYTGDFTYIPEMGLEVLIGIARFWHQRTSYSEDKNASVILGVTGPNEYENNVNNNWYTNYLAKWCLEFTLEQIQKVKDGYPEDYKRIIGKTKLTDEETALWEEVAKTLYFPYSKKHKVFLQQDGFLDKDLIPASEIDPSERPINQHWSWDRILRSPFIKQADVLQGFYFFEDHFTEKELQQHFSFYEPLTVHESSLSPCVHAILAAKLNRIEQAYSFYLMTSRLDLDDYNKEVAEGLHITSMAGTWLSVVEGFAGMRVLNDKLSFTPRIPDKWTSYSFVINFRGRLLKVTINKKSTCFELQSKESMSIRLNGQRVELNPGEEKICDLEALASS